MKSTVTDAAPRANPPGPLRVCGSMEQLLLLSEAEASDFDRGQAWAAGLGLAFALVGLLVAFGL